MRRTARRIRAQTQCAPDDSRTARRFGLRVRVPDGIDEPPALARYRNDLPRSRHAVFLFVGIARARDCFSGRRCDGFRPARGPGTTQEKARLMSAFLEQIQERAAAAPKRIAFSEMQDDRTVQAIGQLEARGLVDPVAVIETEKDRRFEQYAETFYTLRKHRG